MAGFETCPAKSLGFEFFMDHRTNSLKAFIPKHMTIATASEELQIG
jgi:hypothetical protein